MEMDKDVLDQQLQGLCQKAMAEARAAVQAAPDGQWIAASEWRVREIFQKLTRDCYQLMLQARADAHPAATQAAFSPSAGGRGGGGSGAAQQGKASPSHPDRQRRD
jgi:hypothetical protein